MKANAMPAERYFYTDPLAAAWMAKHFGMQIFAPVFAAGTGKYSQSRTPLPVWCWARKIEQAELAKNTDGERYYIHPDSLHLLEPRVGDVVQFTACDYANQPGLQQSRVWWKPYLDKWSLPQDAGNIRIIQRDGKPFHWPEKE